MNIDRSEIVRFVLDKNTNVPALEIKNVRKLILWLGISLFASIFIFLLVVGGYTNYKHNVKLNSTIERSIYTNIKYTMEKYEVYLDDVKRVFFNGYKYNKNNKYIAKSYDNIYKLTLNNSYFIKGYLSKYTPDGVLDSFSTDDEKEFNALATVSKIFKGNSFTGDKVKGLFYISNKNFIMYSDKNVEKYFSSSANSSDSKSLRLGQQTLQDNNLKNNPKKMVMWNRVVSKAKQQKYFTFTKPVYKGNNYIGVVGVVIDLEKVISNLDELIDMKYFSFITNKKYQPVAWYDGYDTNKILNKKDMISMLFSKDVEIKEQLGYLKDKKLNIMKLKNTLLYSFNDGNNVLFLFLIKNYHFIIIFLLIIYFIVYFYL